jgi:hypothetical protein
MTTRTNERRRVNPDYTIKTPAKGRRDRNGMNRVTCTFDDDTMEEIRSIAIKKGTGSCTIIRLLVEFGLETYKEDSCTD